MKKKKNNLSNKLGESISYALDIPADVMLNIPHINMSGNLGMSIENVKNIIEYTKTFITVNTSSYPIKINGENLEISFLCKGEISIKGSVKSLEFIK